MSNRLPFFLIALGVVLGIVTYFTSIAGSDLVLRAIRRGSQQRAARRSAAVR